VLSQVARLFEDDDLWLMYGSYNRYPPDAPMLNPAKPFPAEVVANASFREHSVLDLVYNHPLVFRRWLFNCVYDWELKDDNGEWFTTSYDHAIMMPMLELAADGHFHYNPEVLYTYNEENTTSEAKHPDLKLEAIRVHNTINGREKREPFKCRPF
jgi:hypothetical protein